MTRVARAFERDETAGLMKIIVDASNDRILGASILASEGGELVQILGALMLAISRTPCSKAPFHPPNSCRRLLRLLEDVKPVD